MLNNEPLPTSTSVLLLGVGLISIGRLARKSRWSRMGRALPEVKA
jgi:hypothetical protein